MIVEVFDVNIFLLLFRERWGEQVVYTDTVIDLYSSC